MKFTMTKMVASVALAISAGNAQAVLSSANTLSIQADAVVSQIGTPASPTWTISSDGPLADSFFTMGGTQTKTSLNTQYSFLSSSTTLTLSGVPQANIATFFPFYSESGEIETVGTGISILSASGDTATVDMSGLTWAFSTNPYYPVINVGSGAWSSGYINGVGNVTCETGSECALGSAYTLKYTATTPLGDPSGISGVKLYFEMHGTVGAVPEASTYSMMLVGLGLLGAVVRRRTR